MGYELDEKRPGIREVNLAISNDTDFETLVKVLRETLVVPDLPGVRGCAPCLSGLDRFVLQSDILRTGF